MQGSVDVCAHVCVNVIEDKKWKGWADVGEQNITIFILLVILTSATELNQLLDYLSGQHAEHYTAFRLWTDYVFLSNFWEDSQSST